MKDYLVRVIAKNANIRALACVTTRLVDETCKRHGTTPTASAALGRALTAGTLMGALLKTGQRVAFKFEGNGPLRKIVVEAESNGAVRGYVGDPHADVPSGNGKLNVSGALGKEGLLTVTKDLRLKEPYKSVVKLYSGEIAEDLAYYLTESEQVPSAVGLGVFVEPEGDVSAAGGFLVQSLPPADEELIDRLVGRIGSLPTVTEMLRGGRKPEDILDLIFEDIPIEVLEKRELTFLCSCSRERVECALLSLGPKEIRSIASGEDRVDVSCEFCGQKYVFSREELELLAGEIH
ncbi:MAG: Hsp33 family molecular chaperone HslO [Desulfobacteraceae bacterium]|nr:Hsp33 family molecular chaperone HslO [Desulfobacteraceae bacterium]